MKRIKFLSFCCIAVFLLTACGSSSSKNEEEKISVTGADGKEYTSYQEACRAGDFEAAHKFLDVYMTNILRAMEKLMSMTPIKFVKLERNIMQH